MNGHRLQGPCGSQRRLLKVVGISSQRCFIAALISEIYTFNNMNNKYCPSTRLSTVYPPTRFLLTVNEASVYLFYSLFKSCDKISRFITPSGKKIANNEL
jgi:hypothetical protein